VDNVALELRKAAVTLHQTDDIVKVAGLFKYIKRLIFGPEEVRTVSRAQKKVEKKFNELRDIFSRMDALTQAAPTSAREKATLQAQYQTLLAVAQRALTETARVLSEALGGIDQAHDTAKSFLVDPETGRAYQEGQLDVLKNIQKGFDKNPEIMRQLQNQRKASLDVPITTSVNAPITDFSWFQKRRPNDIYISDKVKDTFYENLVNTLHRHTSWRKNQIRPMLQRGISKGPFNRMIEQIRKAILRDSYLKSYWYAKPSKNVTHRPANEMEFEVDVGPINIPTTDLWIHVYRVKVVDMFAAQLAKLKMSVKHIYFSFLSDVVAFEDEKKGVNVRNSWREWGAKEAEDDQQYQQWKLQEQEKIQQQAAQQAGIDNDVGEWMQQVGRQQTSQMQEYMDRASEIPIEPPSSVSEPEESEETEIEETSEEEKEPTQEAMDAVAQRVAELYSFAKAEWWNDPVNTPKGAALPDSFWIKYVQMCQRLGVDPMDLAAVINRESGFDASARNLANGPNNPPVAQGFNQMLRSTAKMVGIDGDLWKEMYKMSPEEQLPYVEKYFKKLNVKGKDAGGIYLLNFGGFNNPDGSLYAGKAAQARWLAKHPEDKFTRPDFQQKVIEQNAGFVKDDRIMPATVRAHAAKGVGGALAARIQEAIKRVGNSPPPPFEEPNPNVGRRKRYENIDPMSERKRERIMRKRTRKGVGVEMTSQDQAMVNRLDQMADAMWRAAEEDDTPLYVKRAAYRRHLPRTRVIISIPNGADLSTRIRYAHTLRTALRNVIDAESSIHHYGDKLEIEADVYGSKTAVVKAARGVAEGVAAAFNSSFDKDLGKVTVYPGIRSRYALIESSIVEDSFRKFAMEAWSVQ